MDRKGYAIVAFAVLLLGSFLAWEWYLSPEAQVRRTIERAAEAAETLDLAGFLDTVSPDYSDYMNLDRSTLEERLREGFSRIDRMNITVSGVDVIPDGASASARFDLMAVAIRGEERFVLIGTPLAGEKVQAFLEKSDDGWKIQRVERNTATEAASPR